MNEAQRTELQSPGAFPSPTCRHEVIGERLSHVAKERRRHVAALLAAQPSFAAPCCG